MWNFPTKFRNCSGAGRGSLDETGLLIEPQYPAGKTGRPSFPIATMLQIRLMRQWFGLSDPAMEDVELAVSLPVSF